MTSEVKDTVELEVHISAPPETVFSYFTDPDRMMKWMGVSAEVEARPGGVFRVNITGHDVAAGEYLEIDNPHRVVFSWGWEGSAVGPGSTKVEVELAPDGDGTRLVLRHSGLPTDQQGPHREGWEHYLARLVTAAQGGDAGPDPWATGSHDQEK